MFLNELHLPKSIENIVNKEKLKIWDKLDVMELSRCPIEGHNGHWEDKKGDSEWKPNKADIPPCSNPENKNWGQILEKHKIDGIEYKDGKPDFSPIAKNTVEIDDFTENRAKNFEQADEKLAKQSPEKWKSAEDVENWRKENNYTWHECSDCKTMQLVPSEVHNNMPHSGGISEYKSKKEV